MPVNGLPPRAPALRLTPITGALCALAVLAGCLQPKQAGQRDPWTPADSPLAAATMRLHPLTRFLPATGNAEMLQIEAHVELMDRWGHPTKELGTLVFALRRSSGIAGGGPEQLKRWIIQMEDPEINAQRYDPVTRTYRVLLGEIPRPYAFTGAPTLEASFTTLTGRTLGASIELARPREEPEASPD